MALLGILIGGGAVVLSRALTRFVFQVGTLDPVTFAAAPLLLGAAAPLATFLPAHRATRVDPLRAAVRLIAARARGIHDGEKEDEPL